MGLSWQQGPLAPAAIGRFLVPSPLPERMLFAEPLRRRMQVRFASTWIADSENVVLLHEPGRYPVAYFPIGDVSTEVLQPSAHTTPHRDLGTTSWYTVAAGDRHAERAAWQYKELPAHAQPLEGRVAFAWRLMDSFHEEDERIIGHAADSYHRIDIRRSSRHLVVRSNEQVVADTTSPLVLFESGFAPRWYVPRADINDGALVLIEGQTFCPYKGLASYYEIDGQHGAAWFYEKPWTEVSRIAGHVSFEADKVEVYLDDRQLHLEPGQTVIAHGVDRDLSVDELIEGQRPDRHHARRAGPAGKCYVTETKATIDRVSAYSDSVFAVIVTIMVLQLKAPQAATFSALFALWPTVVSYVVSYMFIAIIWINHHHLMRFVKTANLSLIWTNFVHLFFVSLLPFTTEWIAQTRLATVPVMVYAGLFVCADGLYNAFERQILAGAAAIDDHGRWLARSRSRLAFALFTAGILGAAIQPWLGFSLVCLALVLHLQPDVGSLPTSRLAFARSSK